MPTTFDPIADFVARPNVPDSARQMAALLLVDTLGVAAGATHLEPSIIARDHAVTFHGASDPSHRARLLFDGTYQGHGRQGLQLDREEASNDRGGAAFSGQDQAGIRDYLRVGSQAIRSQRCTLSSSCH